MHFLNLIACFCAGNQHLNDAMRSSANDLNLAWIGAFPGVRVRTINLLAFCASSEI